MGSGFFRKEDFEVSVHGKFGVLPVCMGEGSVGWDIALPEREGNLLMPYNSRRAIDTGIILKPPMKCFVMIVPRSSSRKRGIRISNTIGIVDPSYCGQNDTLIVDLTRDSKKSEYVGTFRHGTVALPLNIVAKLYEDDTKESSKNLTFLWDKDLCLYHLYQEPEDDLLVYKAGERFCQVIFFPWYKPELVEKTLEAFGEDRGGFGSTGQ
jgi:dUTPase